MPQFGIVLTVHTVGSNHITSRVLSITFTSRHVFYLLLLHHVTCSIYYFHITSRVLSITFTSYFYAIRLFQQACCCTMNFINSGPKNSVAYWTASQSSTACTIRTGLQCIECDRAVLLYTVEKVTTIERKNDVANNRGSTTQ